MTVESVPLAETAAALRGGERDPARLAEAGVDRIEAIDPDVRAVLGEPDRAERVGWAVEDLLERFPEPAERPPLFAVPVGVKDIFHVEGFPTRAGSELPPETLAGPEAEAVRRLLDSGAVVLGKTVTTEFAFYAPGPTRNPHDLGHTPGGSSSGSAAAVAAGLCPLALGTQTAGSVNRPAAFCGVVGFKPTYGRIPTDGVVSLAPSLDTVGTFTTDVPGARLTASVLCDDWDADVGSDVGPGDRPTLGVPAEAYLERAEPVGRDRFAATVADLEDAGYTVERTDVLADIERIVEDHRTLMAAEAALVHEDWFEAYGERYAPMTRELVEEGREVPVGELAAAVSGQGDVREAVEAAIDDHGVDGWVAPAAPGPAPEGIESTGDPVMNTPWTYAGLPAVSLPAGDVDGLPVGLQCVGRHDHDERLLEWAEPVARLVGDAA